MEDANLIFNRILAQALQVPGARVSRTEFLEKNLKYYCPPEQIGEAVNISVRKADISGEVLERIAESLVKMHTFQVTGISTLSGMPGGLAMVATIPADLVQYYYHVIVLAQKLAYLYGYPQFDKNDIYGDDELISHLTLFIGVMYDVDGADKALLAVSNDLAADTLARVPEETLKETSLYLLKKNIARWVGLKVTRKTFSQSVSKVIPFVSGIISGGVSYISFTPMAQNLKTTLEEAHKTGWKIG